MNKKGFSCKSIHEMVEDYRIEKKVLNDKDVFLIIDDLRTVIEMNTELGYLEKIKTDILSLKNDFGSENNVIIKEDSIKNAELKKITVEVLKMLGEQGLLLVLEPNNNLYMDIDIDKLINVLKNCASLECLSVLLMLQNIQEQSFIDMKGNFKEENFKKIYQDILVSADFEKNEVRFKYICGILNYLDNLARAYSQK